MARKATPVTLDKETSTAIINILNDMTIDRNKYTRALVLQKLANGSEVKQIAEELQISKGTVIEYRNKFKAGGLAALMQTAPNLGRCGNGGIPVFIKVQNYITETKSDDITVKDIAEKTNSSLSAVYEALHNLKGGEPKSQNMQLPESLKQGNNEVRGIYVSSSVQILAVSHTSQDYIGNALKDECLVTYDSSDVEYRESPLVRDSERVVTLATQSLLSFNNHSKGKIQSPADFIQTILHTPYVNGGETIFLINAKDQNDIKDYLQDSLTVYTNLSFKDVKVIWHEAIDLGNSSANMFLNKISEFLDKSSENSRPFTCRFARILKDQHMPFYLNNTCIEFQLLNTTVKKDSFGNIITCTSYCYDEVPSSETFTKSVNREQYESDFDTLEESLLKVAHRSIHNMAENTLCSSLNLDELSNPNTEEKQRLVELESQIGRPLGVINSQIDTSAISSHSRLWSPKLKGKVIRMANRSSFTEVADNLNSMLMRDECIKFSPRTLNDCCQRWGHNVHQNVLQQTHDILVKAGFDPDSAKPLSDTQLHSCPNEYDIQQMQATIQEMLDDFKQNHPNFPDMVGALESVELPENSVVLLIDDVSCHRQKEHRDVNGKVGSKSAETVGNTTAAILFDNNRYVITADNTREALTIALAYMLKHKLLENRLLVTFSDGASEIRKAIPEIFGFHKALKQYLDWYHVRKRINENLSMGLKCGKENREKKQEIINNILTKLWFGDIDAAINIIKSIDVTFIRNSKKVQDTISYLEARRPYLYCYAARKLVGVTNSSARVEGLNDKLVACRQKNKGMSWSECGSRGLASLATVIENGDLDNWIKSGKVRFSQMRRPEIAAAS